MDSGAHFHNCDLQVHTPRDVRWSGVKPTSSANRAEFARNFVAACRAKRLNAVAITDHHDFTFYEFIRTAAENERSPEGSPLATGEQLVVFPGLELTLAVPCQALLILDANFPLDRLESVLVALSIDATDPALPSHKPPKQLPHQELGRLYETLDKQPWLKGRYIVFPNVTDSGHQTLMRSHMQEKYRTMPCVGGYIDAGARVGAGNERIFAGKDKSYGDKRLAIIHTSDSRSDSFTDLGKHTTWIKWAQPTAEALRQACLAAESRICRTAPQLPNARVTRLSISNSKFMGPIELELNPQYTSVIGGRGTGKSTLLEYLRWTLCDQPPHPAATDEMTDPAARRHALIAATLAPFDSHVDVHFVLNGIAHTVRRRAKTGEVALRIGEQEFAPVTQEDVRTLLPIEAYSQRQLSSVAVRLDEVMRFVTSAIRRELDELRDREGDVAAQLRDNYGSVQRFRALQRSSRRDEVEVRSLTEQANNVREQLSAVSPEDQGILSQKPSVDRANDVARVWLRRIEQLSAEVKRFDSAVDALQTDLPGAPEVPESAASAVAALESAVRAALAGAVVAANEMDSALEATLSPTSQLRATEAGWRDVHGKFQAAYAGAKDRSAAHAGQLTQLEELEKRRALAADSVARQNDEIKLLGDPSAGHSALRSQWVAIQQERSALIQRQCDGLTKLSDGLIRASLEPRVEVAAIAERFRGAVVGSGVRRTQIDAFLGQISESPDPLVAWLEALDGIERYVLAGDEPTAQSTPAVSGALQAFVKNDVEKIAARISAEQVLDLSLVSLGDRPVFEYGTKAGEYIPFEKASPGQQATALLRVLLSQPGLPLIVDQPEDDLDSQVVLEIVERIWGAKSQRQLIFASHNANLVVNGDAELVVTCDYRAAGDQSDGKMKFEGAIDVPDVRGEIATVMEGGERAFRMRQAKYGF